jgi:hypothetical protein|tara:strand:- start:833 stop:1090 length:258 start_codon:yes stop_codon:yes gene_type:complete
MELDKIKQKRTDLIEKFNDLQDTKLNTEKNLKLITDDLLTLRGAVLLCNELIEIEEPPEDNEPKPLFPEKEVVVNDLDKEEEDNG